MNILVRNRLPKLYELLNNLSYYSLRIDYVAKKIGLSIAFLKKLDHSTQSVEAKIFEEMTGDSINVFVYNNVTYIGLETRRIA